MNLLNANASSRVVDFLRAYIYLLWLVAVGLNPLVMLATLPDDGFVPVGMLRLTPPVLTPLLLSRWGLLALQVVLLLTLAAALFRRNAKLPPLLACLLLTVYQCVARGYGHINHAEIVLLLATYVFTYCDFMRAKEDRESDSSVALPVVAIALILCVSYSLTGTYRVLHGGWQIFYNDSLTQWICFAENSPRFFNLEPGRALMQHVWFRRLLQIGFPLVTLMEITAPLCLFSRKYRYAFLALMAPFHLMVLMLMGILFWENLALYVVLLDLEGIKRWLDGRGLIRGERKATSPAPAL